MLKKSIFETVREAGTLTAVNLMGKESSNENENEDALIETKAYEKKQKAILRSFDALPALVNWDTWGSKLDSVFSPVFAAGERAKRESLLEYSNNEVRETANNPIRLAHKMNEHNLASNRSAQPHKPLAGTWKRWSTSPGALC